MKQEIKKVNGKLWLITLLSVAVIFAVYQVAVMFEFKPIIHIYAALLFISALCFGMINRGFSNKKVTHEDLPRDWDTERKNAFIADTDSRRRRAKIFLIPIIGILVTLAYDVIYLVYIEPLL